MKLPLTTLLSFFVTAAFAAEDAPLPEKIEFNRDVRGILSENCFACHGFDSKTRNADRRLDLRDGALAELDGFRAIVPGKLTESEVHHRITSSDPDEVMPPPKSAKKLTPREVAILNKWIEQGAEYQDHWAYLPPVKPALPEIGDSPFVKNSIDRLVLARQRALGFQHAPEADRRTLIRRASFDLTGLPPTPADVREFLSDAAPDAYERLVDRLIASPAFGERMAIYWLDVVRFADTMGAHADNPRNLYPFRDYVIAAFNGNKPFDQFTIEQLAGDLLPNATRTQKVASAFNRLNMATEEGGAQPKEYEAKTVSDRVRALGTVWLAQTTGCAECHDHKFDPITAKDFYQLGAFFADIKEPAIGHPGAGMPLPTPEQEAKLAEYAGRISALEKVLDTATSELAAAQVEWEKGLAASTAAVEWTPLHPEKLESENGAQLTVEAGEVLRATAPEGGKDVYRLTIKSELPEITGLRIEALASSRLPQRGPGLSDNGNFVLNEVTIAQADANGGEPQKLKIKAASATFEQKGFSAKAAVDGVADKREKGWAVLGRSGQDSAIFFELAEPLRGEEAKTLVVTLEQNYGRNHTLGKFRISATAASKPAAAGKPKDLPQEIAAILAIAAEQRNEAQQAQLAKHYRTLAPELAEPRAQLAAVKKEQEEFDKTVAKCLVVEPLDKPRTVRVLARGNWQDDSGEVVTPALPHRFAKPPADDRRLTRLDLAQWIASRDNPLTARVFVNRLWKLHFGTGLSKVLDDFGAQGEAPVNAELLDWLACEFMDSGWNVKHIVRLIATSGTYRQSSQPRPEQIARDPYNRELASQSRFRLDAELVRDNALAISGLLVRTIGGPSVKPYQPAGYWENLNFPTREWQADKNEDQWRRGLYTWWQRSYLHPSLLAFDAPSREECTAERVRSNIPQQALVLLNDPTYVEAARVFAARIIAEGGADPAQRIGWAFEQALSRAPRGSELQVIRELFEKHLATYKKDAAAAEQLVKTGIAPSPPEVPVSELAAWTSIARVILNLHETITRS